VEERHASSPRELAERLGAERRAIPFLSLRDAAQRQRVVVLDPDRDRFTVGRTPPSDLCLDWDPEVSRLHAALERLGDQWVVADDGLLRNGTFVNEQRVQGRRRLEDGDTPRFGGTRARYHAPVADGATETALAGEAPPVAKLSDTQRRVLIALARPYRDAAPFATPASNQQIAGAVFLSVDAVKAHLRVLYEKFGVEHLPQNRKRAALVERGFQTGAVGERDF
jgi:hypothetical protein